MQQSQIIGISILSGGCGGKIIYIDNKRRGTQDLSLGDAISWMLKPALLAITDVEGEASILDKLQDHLNHMLIQQKS